MKIKIQRIGKDKHTVADMPEVPRRGDVVSLPDADRTIAAVDWNVGGGEAEFVATIWVR